MKKHMHKHRLTALLSMALCLSLVAACCPISASAKSVDELQKEIAGYQSQLNQLGDDAQDEAAYQDTLTAQISALEQEMEAYQSQLDTLNAQIDSQSDDINALQSDIDAKQGEINQMTNQINEKQMKIEDTQDQLRQRMVEDYKAGQTSTLDVLLSSEDFGEFISNVTYVQKIAEHDKQLTDTLDQEIADINEDKAVQQAAVDELNSQKAVQQAEVDKVQEQANQVMAIEDEMQSTGETLSAQLSKSQSNSAAIKSAQASLNKQKANAESELEDATNAIREASDNIGGGNVPIDSGGYLFPVAPPCYISQDYKGSAHKGVDIATYGNTNEIYASRGGTVITAMHNAPRGSGFGGYGNVVVIDHGDGYQTLYGHMNDFNVSVGQQVSRGQMIGHVGNTGDSTGYHLHFELRYNGTPVQPPFHS